MDVNPMDDQESSDAAPLDDASDGFDLAPRTTASTSDSGNNNRKYVAIGAAVLLIAGLGFVLFKGLDEAATFFYNVDEATELRDDLEGERFRMQGNVDAGTVEETADGVSFVLSFGGESVAVSHTGTPPELFGAGIPVVVEGEYSGDVFVSDEILVKHDSSYDEDHPERISEAEESAAGSSPQ